MKKWIKIAGLLALMLPVAAPADDFACATNADNTITITSYTGSDENVTIPNETNGLTITSIGTNAFLNCTNLTSITIPNSVTSISEAAFCGCTGLTNAVIGNNVNRIEDRAFQNCVGLTGIIIPDSVTILGGKSRGDFIQKNGWGGAFQNCASLISVTIGCGVTDIDYKAFSDCTSLTDIMIPDNVRNIGSSAFSGCSNMTNVIIGKGVATIGPGAFSCCTSLDSITIPDNVIRIGTEAFFGCISLANVALGNGVATIGAGAFYSCTSLTSIAISGKITRIGDWNTGETLVFHGMSVYECATFGNCTGLTNVTIGASVTYIGENISLPFSGCINLTTITVETSNSVYSSENGVLFNKSQTTLIQYPAGKIGPYTMPAGTTSIMVRAVSGGAFSGCFGLTEVTIPDSVTSIEDGTFSGCVSLTSITIPNSVTRLGTPPFMLFEIGTGVFSGCTNLTKVTIGNQVTYIAGQPFSGCNSLTEVYFLGNAPGLQMHVIGGAIDNSVTVYYLAGTSGWETSFMGWPTALWNPLIHASGENLGVQTNGFSFNVSGIADQVVVVEACTNLAEGVWVPVETNTLTGGSIQFSDPAFTNYPNRYYRVSMPQ